MRSSAASENETGAPGAMCSMMRVSPRAFSSTPVAREMTPTAMTLSYAYEYAQAKSPSITPAGTSSSSATVGSASHASTLRPSPAECIQKTQRGSSSFSPSTS